MFKTTVLAFTAISHVVTVAIFEVRIILANEMSFHHIECMVFVC